MEKSILALLLSMLLLSACAAGGQAPAPEPSTLPESLSSAAEPAPEVSSSEPELSSVPEESSQPDPEPEPEPESSRSEEPVSDPNGSWENPDTSDIAEEPEKVRALEWASTQADTLQEELRATMPKGIYGSIFAWSDWDEEVEPETARVVLEISVTDEKAVDEFLTNWKGTKWDTVKKIPAVCSRAAAEALAKKIKDHGYDFGPGTTWEVYEWAGLVFVRVDHWEDEYTVAPFPAELAKIAEEEGLQEALYYEDSYKGNGGRAEKVFGTDTNYGTIVNPDT